MSRCGVGVGVARGKIGWVGFQGAGSCRRGSTRRGLSAWLVSTGSGEGCHGSSGGGGRRGSGGGCILGLLQLTLELLANTGLQGGWGQPLLGQAALEEGHAGAEVG